MARRKVPLSSKFYPETEREIELARLSEQAKRKAFFDRLAREERGRRVRPFIAGRENIRERLGQFRSAAPPVDFTPEQEALNSMFGGGEKVWGYGEPVRINHDLNPRQRGDFSTAALFGF